MSYKLISSQLNELKQILRDCKTDIEVFKVLTSASHQSKSYAHYQQRKDYTVTLRSGQKITLNFSKLPKKKESVISGTGSLSDLLTQHPEILAQLSDKHGWNKQPDVIPVQVPEPVLHAHPKAKSAKCSYTVRLDSADRDRLQQLANDSDIPVSQLLRAAVKEYLKTIK